MERRWIGYAPTAIGLVPAVVSLAADPLGIGEGSGIGWKQIVGAVVGAVFVLGALLVVRRPGTPASGS